MDILALPVIVLVSDVEVAALVIGAVAGCVGAATQGWAFAMLGGGAGGVGGFLAGSVSGAIGTTISLPTENLGNHVYFGDPLLSTTDYLKEIGASALQSGLTNGIIAEMNGRTFFRGQSRFVDINVSTIQPVKIANSYKTEFDIDKKIGKISPYEKGQIGVRWAMQEFEESGGVVLRKEVTVEVDGIRNRFDFVGRKDNVLHFFEIKNGPHATPTKNQLINIPKLCEPGATFIPVGKNAANIRELKFFEKILSPRLTFFLILLHYAPLFARQVEQSTNDL